MYAITLWQPWASLIADGVKKQETRSWAPPKHLIGERIAIHAAKRKLTKAELRELPSMIHHDISARYGHFWEEDVPYGAVVATVELGGACEIKGPLLTPERGLLGHHCYTNEPCRVYSDIYGDYSVGRIIWWLKDIEKFQEPVPAAGKQGFWDWKES